ncbi:hypothetical protein [Streptomyces rishiriensis]|uniref:Uncharacterized protein n=1 Tax=Streptomyces rishiriensis TaxID=68264 RepID=A0ABU0P2X5_STRRH|nr:hypothetical protein [Streptomyces rishiriensis]MDQ0585729.1 hypothetical protein [Streptomyces rishiriensis]
MHAFVVGGLLRALRRRKTAAADHTGTTLGGELATSRAVRT